MAKERAIKGERISVRLKALRKSQSWLADQVGMTQQAISDIVLGQTRRPRKLLELSLALETSQEYLLGQTDDPTPSVSDPLLFAYLSDLQYADRRQVADLIFSLREKELSAKRKPSPRLKAPKRRP